jgi:hypothetical protein
MHRSRSPRQRIRRQSRNPRAASRGSFDTRSHFEPAQHRHLHVHQNQIKRISLQRIQRRAPILRNHNDLPALLQRSPSKRLIHRIIFHRQHAKLRPPRSVCTVTNPTGSLESRAPRPPATGTLKINLIASSKYARRAGSGKYARTPSARHPAPSPRIPADVSPLFVNRSWNISPQRDRRLSIHILQRDVAGASRVFSLSRCIAVASNRRAVTNAPYIGPSRFVFTIGRDTYRRSQRYPVGREISNSSHRPRNGCNPRLAAVTNSTRCCCTSIVLGIPSLRRAKRAGV